MNILHLETITILLIEDNEDFSKKVFNVFEKTSLITRASTLSQARSLLNEKTFDICLIDYTLPDGYGTELLGELKTIPDRGPVIFLSANSDPEVKKLCFSLGVDDYIEKDSNFQTNLLIRIPRIINTNRHKKRNEALSAIYKDSFRNEIIGESTVIKELRLKLDILRSESISSLLIRGAPGSGKELAANYFNKDIRNQRTLIKVECSLVTNSSFDIDFLGFQKTRFTEELPEKPGFLELAHEGDLFLKNIDHLSLQNQRKLLSFLTNREYLPVNGTTTKISKTRIIASTNSNIENCIQNGKFLKSLYQRISLHTVTIPSLESRLDDIPFLVKYFLAIQKESSLEMSKQALTLLKETDWPENVRELFESLKEAYINAKLRSSQKIEAKDFKKKNLSTNIKLLLPRHERDVNKQSLDQYLQKAEEIYWKEAFKIFNGNASRLARESTIPLSTINNKIKDFDLRSYYD